MASFFEDFSDYNLGPLGTSGNTVNTDHDSQDFVVVEHGDDKALSIKNTDRRGLGRAQVDFLNSSAFAESLILFSLRQVGSGYNAISVASSFSKMPSPLSAMIVFLQDGRTFLRANGPFSSSDYPIDFQVGKKYWIKIKPDSSRSYDSGYEFVPSLSVKIWEYGSIEPDGYQALISDDWTELDGYTSSGPPLELGFDYAEADLLIHRIGISNTESPPSERTGPRKRKAVYLSKSSIYGTNRSQYKSLASIYRVSTAAYGSKSSLYKEKSATYSTQSSIIRQDTVSYGALSSVYREFEAYYPSNASIIQVSQASYNANASVYKNVVQPYKATAAISSVAASSYLSIASVQSTRGAKYLAASSIINPTPDKLPQNWRNSGDEQPTDWKNSNDEVQQDWRDNSTRKEADWQRQYYD